MKLRLAARSVPLSRLAVIGVLVLLLVSTASAQLSELRIGRSTLTGEVFSDSGNTPPGLSIELLGVGASNFSSTTPLNPDHRFSLLDLPAGDYELRVVDPAGNVLRRNPVNVSEAGTHVEVHLPARQGEQSTVETISVARLRHRPPAKARKAFDKALAASQNGKSERAIAHLNQAISVDPAYMEAHHNLGVCRLRMGQFAEAVEHFQHALALDDTAELVYSNLAIAYAGLEKYHDAEQAARKSLELGSRSNRSRYILGLALDAQRREPREALENLQAAAREIPSARLAAARILARLGQNTHAAAELRKYLASDQPHYRRQVETWLATLER